MLKVSSNVRESPYFLKLNTVDLVYYWTVQKWVGWIK